MPLGVIGPGFGGTGTMSAGPAPKTPRKQVYSVPWLSRFPSLVRVTLMT